MEELFYTLGEATGVALLIIVIVILINILNWILYLKACSDLSKIVAKQNETNKIMMAILQEQEKLQNAIESLKK